MSDQGAVFRMLHERGNPFILANAWDRGSAKMLQALGAKAIATSSAAHAFTLGRVDGQVSRDEVLAHAQQLMGVVSIPVSGDFENGFGDAPESCAETVRLAAEIGLAGISIEDTALPHSTAYEREFALERIKAASAAARALPQDFFLLARADGMMHGTYGLDEALQRVRAFDAAGADGLYVPALGKREDIAQVCAATDKPVNVLVSGQFSALTQAELAQMGVARISLGSALARVTHRAIADIGDAMFGHGDFSGLGKAASGDAINALLQ